MHQRGFSLIELLMGLTIVGIVLHLVSPAFAALSESTYREETPGQSLCQRYAQCKSCRDHTKPVRSSFTA